MVTVYNEIRQCVVLQVITVNTTLAILFRKLILLQSQRMNVVHNQMKILSFCSPENLRVSAGLLPMESYRFQTCKMFSRWLPKAVKNFNAFDIILDEILGSGWNFILESHMVRWRRQAGILGKIFRAKVSHDRRRSADFWDPGILILIFQLLFIPLNDKPLLTSPLYNTHHFIPITSLLIIMKFKYLHIFL